MMSKPERRGAKVAQRRKYRRAFLLTLFAFIAVRGDRRLALVALPFNPMTRNGRQPAIASETAQPDAQNRRPVLPVSTRLRPDTPLAPIQLSPQRMQSIGVKRWHGRIQGRSTMKSASYGNVQANERRFAYVQTRFAGWIRQVYADATGDFVAQRTAAIHNLQSRSGGKRTESIYSRGRVPLRCSKAR